MLTILGILGIIFLVLLLVDLIVINVFVGLIFKCIRDLEQDIADIWTGLKRVARRIGGK